MTPPSLKLHNNDESIKTVGQGLLRGSCWDAEARTAKRHVFIRGASWTADHPVGLQLDGKCPVLIRTGLTSSVAVSTCFKVSPSLLNDIPVIRILIPVSQTSHFDTNFFRPTI